MISRPPIPDSAGATIGSCELIGLLRATFSIWIAEDKTRHAGGFDWATCLLLLAAADNCKTDKADNEQHDARWLRNRK
jgi:hypothetical protein